MKAYEARLKTLDRLLAIKDVTRKLEAYWQELTGERVTFSFGGTYFYAYFSMGRLMRNGRYPNKHQHVSAMIERADELLEGLVAFDDFREKKDVYSHDFLWGKPYNEVLKLYFRHGGNCAQVQVGTRTVEEPIYEYRCD